MAPKAPKGLKSGNYSNNYNPNKSFKGNFIMKIENNVKRGLYFLYVHEMKMYFKFKKFGIYDKEEKYKMEFIDYEINTINNKYKEDND